MTLSDRSGVGDMKSPGWIYSMQVSSIALKLSPLRLLACVARVCQQPDSIHHIAMVLFVCEQTSNASKLFKESTSHLRLTQTTAHS